MSSHILIVEDDARIVDLIADTLAKAGAEYQVHRVADSAAVAGHIRGEPGGAARPFGLQPEGVTSHRDRPASIRARIRREGKYWILTVGDRVIPLGRLTSLGFLVYLLRRPGEYHHVVEMATEVDGCVPARAASGFAIGPGPHQPGTALSADPLLDTVAIRQLRDRLGELQSEIDEAEMNNDLYRASTLRREFEEILEHGAKALSPRGRQRKFPDWVDRLRQRVQKAITSANKAIETGDPLLARYLRFDVKTGFWCIYQPDPSHPVLWSF